MEKKSTAFLEVIAANKGLIYKVANSYCKSAEDRKDLIQEIIIQLWQSFEKYNPEYQLSTWMYRIALNVSISFYRKSKNRERISNTISEDIISSIEDETTEETNEDIKLLNQFISELKELDKALMILYLEGKSQKEISEILGISTSNVSTKVLRVKQQLKKRFSKIRQNGR